MNLKDIFFLAQRNITRNKFKTTIHLLVMLLFFLLILIFFSGTNSINAFITKYLNSDFHYKIIGIEMNEETKDRKQIISEINNLKLNEVSKIFDHNYYLFSTVNIKLSQNVNGQVELYGNYDGVKYTIVKGREIKNENEIICPSEFYPGVVETVTSSELISLNDYIGNNLEINYSQHILKAGQEKSEVYKTYAKNLKLVGTYNLKDDLASYNMCYVNEKTLEKIIEETEFKMEVPVDSADLYQDLDILILLKEYDDMPNIIKLLNNKGYRAFPYYEMDLNVINTIIIAINILSIILAVISVISIYLFIKNSMRENKKDIALYKLLGFKDDIINNILIIQYLILSIVSWCISFVIAIILKEIVIKVLEKYPLYKVLDIHLYVGEGIIYYFVILISIVLTINNLSQKQKEYSPLKIIGDQE